RQAAQSKAVPLQDDGPARLTEHPPSSDYSQPGRFQPLDRIHERLAAKIDSMVVREGGDIEAGLGERRYDIGTHPDRDILSDGRRAEVRTGTLEVAESDVGAADERREMLEGRRRFRTPDINITNGDEGECRRSHRIPLSRS